MPQVIQRKILPYRQRDLFDIVADVEAYPEFLPWCLATRIRDRDKEAFTADWLIGFRMIRERFTSRVRPSSDGSKIDVSLISGPFRYLETQWRFEPLAEGTEVTVHIDFSFSSGMFQRVLEPLFGEAQRRMIAAFEGRAAVLHGAGLAVPTPA